MDADRRSRHGAREAAPASPGQRPTGGLISQASGGHLCGVARNEWRCFALLPRARGGGSRPSSHGRFKKTLTRSPRGCRKGDVFASRVGSENVRTLRPTARAGTAVS